MNTKSKRIAELEEYTHYLKCRNMGNWEPAIQHLCYLVNYLSNVHLKNLNKELERLKTKKDIDGYLKLLKEIEEFKNMNDEVSFSLDYINNGVNIYDR